MAGGPPKGYTTLLAYCESNPERLYLLDEWDYTANIPFDLSRIYCHDSKRLLAWVCRDCGKNWRESIQYRVKRKLKVKCNHSQSKVEEHGTLALIYPTIASEWHTTLNGSLTPADISWKSLIKVWWHYSCGHEREAIVFNRTKRGDGCGDPECKGRAASQTRAKNTLLTKGSLAETHPILASAWHPTKNGALTPYEVTAWTSARFWWQCKCGYEWLSSPLAGREDSVPCQKCVYLRAAEKNKANALLRNGSLATTHPKLASEFHASLNGKLSVDDLHKGSDFAVWWECPTCGFEWEAVVGKRSTGNGCPGPKCYHALIGSLARERALVSYSESIISLAPQLAIEWDHALNVYGPDQISPGFTKNIWWKGKDCGHSWKMSPKFRLQKGWDCTRCPGSSLERSVVNFIQTEWPGLFTTSDRTVLSGKEIDILIPSLGLGIEVNGEFWHSDRWVMANHGVTARERHEFKRRESRKAGVPLAFVWEQDWLGERSKTEVCVKEFLETGVAPALLRRLSYG